MEKYSELAADKKGYFLGRVNQRWGQLHALEKDWGDKAYKYLFLTNSGGAIAILSFLGAKPDGFVVFYAKVGLTLFLMGIVITGIATAHRVHRSAWLLQSYRNDSEDFFHDKLTWTELYKRDEKRAIGFSIWNYLLPYSCLCAFICGCFSGGLALFGNPPFTEASTTMVNISNAYEISLLQLASAYIGVLASIFFGIGVTRQSSRAISALCMTYVGSNPHTAAAYAAQKAEYIVGTWFLIIAFLTQVISILTPRFSVVTGATAIYSALGGLTIAGITYLIFSRLAKHMAKRYEKTVNEAVNERIADASTSQEKPPEAVQATGTH